MYQHIKEAKHRMNEMIESQYYSLPYQSAGSTTTSTESCNCIGQQPGFPRCPCQMRGLVARDGRWIQPEQDLGPISPLAKVK
jgi:hypothetical protein